MVMSIQEIFLAAKRKVEELSKKIDNGIVYEMVPPPSISKSSNEEEKERKCCSQNEKRYCPYCFSVLNSNEKICSKCGLPVPEKSYRIPNTERGSNFIINVGDIIYNINNEVEPAFPVEVKTSQGNSLIIKPIMTNKAFVRYYPSYENRISLFCSLENFTVIDFETANMYPDSVCQIGIVVVKDNEIVKKKSYLIRPPYNDFRNADIHGITLDDVKCAKTFSELWEEIKPFIENKLVGAYNAQFDIGCLLATLENFKIEMPDFAYFDILQNAKESFQDINFRSYKLKAVARRLKINYVPHEALSDAIAAARVQIECKMTTTFSFMYAKNNKHFEVMTTLFPVKDILAFIRKTLKEMTSSEFDDYAKIIEVLKLAELKGAEPEKILKLRGETFEKCGMNDEALNSYEEAYKINEKIGVKGKILKLRKELLGRK